MLTKLELPILYTSDIEKVKKSYVEVLGFKKVWVLKPSYMKYWDDELYGDYKTEEFNIK